MIQVRTLHDVLLQWLSQNVDNLDVRAHLEEYNGRQFGLGLDKELHFVLKHQYVQRWEHSHIKHLFVVVPGEDSVLEMCDEIIA